MFNQLVVPVDRSAASFEAVPPAAHLAARRGAGITVMAVVDRGADIGRARSRLASRVDQLGPLDVPLELAVDVDRTPDAAIARRIEATPGAIVVMRSHKRGRTGRTADELLRMTLRPMIVVGPHASPTPGGLGGSYVVPVDGSLPADGVLSTVAVWATEFGATPWLVSVVDSHFARTADVNESSAVVGRAHDLRDRIVANVEFDVLHDRNTGKAIVDFATRQDASLIFLATHGRTGVERLRSGSVAADVVRRARLPGRVGPAGLCVTQSVDATGESIRHQVMGLLSVPGRSPQR